MIHEPLWDLHGRTLSLGAEVASTIEGLLRMQNTSDLQRPITLYVIGSPSVAAPCPTDALMVCGLIRALRSPVLTVGLGLLQSTQPLVLAAGTHRRVLLPHSMIALGPIKWDSLPTARIPIGLGHNGHPRSPHLVLETGLAQLLTELTLDPQLFHTERLITATEAIACHLADEVATRTMSTTTPPKEPVHETNR